MSRPSIGSKVEMPKQIVCADGKPTCAARKQYMDERNSQTDMSLPLDEMSKQTSMQLIVGPMKAAKSRNLISRLDYYEKVYKRRVVLVRPKGWHRDGIDEPGLSSSRDGCSSRSCIDIDTIDELDLDGYDVYGFDEAQFVSGLTEVCRSLVFVRGKTVVVAMLNGTSDQKAFPDSELAELVAQATHIEFCPAVCEGCKARATFSGRRDQGPALVKKGDGDQYVSLCVSCISVSHRPA